MQDGPSAKFEMPWLRTLIVVAAFFYAWPSYPGINNPNENVRFFMTAAIVDEGTYALDAVRARWGWVNDAATREGQTYSVKAPGTSLLGIPGYAAYRGVCRALGLDFDRAWALRITRWTSTTVPAALFFFAFLEFLRRRGIDASIAWQTTVTMSFGTLLFGYSLIAVSHATSAACAFVAFASTVAVRERGTASQARASWIGLTAAGVTFFEYPGLIASVVLTVFALATLRPWSRWIGFGVGALAPTLAVMHFQWKAFGSPFKPGHTMLENAAFRDLAQQGFFGSTGFSVDAAVGLLFDGGYGLFAMTPLLLLGLVGFALLARVRRDRAAVATAVTLVLGTYLAICSMNNWRGGWTVGPRYLAVVVPFFAWAAAEALTRWRAKADVLVDALTLGTTASATAVCAGLGAYYPHLPEDLARPFRDALPLWIRLDYAPENLANMVLPLTGTSSMVPFFGLVAALVVLEVPRRRGRAAARFALLASTFAILSLVPSIVGPHGTHTPKTALAYITRHWSPTGQDRVAKLTNSLRAGQLSDVHRAELASHLRTLGRDDEAERVERTPR